MDQTAVGDRACLGITTVLTEIFLLEFSNQGMPKVSYMKAAELYVVVSFGFIFLALVESAIVYKASFWSVVKENKQELEKDEHVEKVIHYSENSKPRARGPRTRVPKKLAPLSIFPSRKLNTSSSGLSHSPSFLAM